MQSIKLITILILTLLFVSVSFSDQSSSYPFRQTAFNPDISLIIDISLVKNKLGEKDFSSLNIPGLLEEIYPEGNIKGFNFNYLELSFFAPVDPYFELFAVVSYEHNEIEVEEAYVNTLSLPFGLNARIGKFLSNFGRHNELHKHYWSFFDAPLIYETLLGPHGLSDVGTRITWTVPTYFFLTLGSEIFQGSYEHNPSFNNEQITLNDEFEIPPHSKPSLFNLFAKTSLDLNKHIFLLGTSILYGPSHLLHSHDENIHAIIADATKLFNIEFTYKYVIDSYRSLTIETEFIKRNLSGNLYQATDSKITQSTIDKYNAGFYSQIIFRFDKYGRWRTGFRYDLIFQNINKINNYNNLLPDSLSKYTAMIEFNPTEFSRSRLQYTYDRSKSIDDELKPNHTLLLQFNFSIGAHGAHKF